MCTTDRTTLVFLKVLLDDRSQNKSDQVTCRMPFPTAATTKGVATWIADMSQSTKRYTT